MGESHDFRFGNEAQAGAQTGMEIIEADTDEQSLLDAMAVVIEVLAVAVPGDTLHLSGWRHGTRVRVSIRAPGVDTKGVFDQRTLTLWRKRLMLGSIVLLAQQNNLSRRKRQDL